MHNNIHDTWTSCQTNVNAMTYYKHALTYTQTCYQLCIQDKAQRTHLTLHANLYINKCYIGKQS